MEYASAGAVFEAIDRGAAEVAARLAAIVKALPSAAEFARSARADLDRHRASREALRHRLRLPAGARIEAGASDASLEGLRGALEALTFAHAEGLPALDSALAVDALARDMVDCSRLLTVVILWIDTEVQRG
jgi:hypothetical protein